MQNDNFFATQISAEKSRPNTTNKIYRLNPNQQDMDAFTRLKLIKSQLKKADQQYRIILSSANKTRSSLDKANRTTQQTRVSFLKVYQSKKLRMLQKNLIEQMKDKQRDYRQQSAQKAKKIKLQCQLQLLLLKNQEQQHLEKLRLQNRKEKQLLKQEKRLKDSYLQQTAKKQYLEVKNAHTELLSRRRKVQSMLEARARQNYLNKINKQIEVLQNYNMLAKQMGDFGLIDDQEPTTKSFFITKN